jgi:hypothetical protein
MDVLLAPSGFLIAGPLVWIVGRLRQENKKLDEQEAEMNRILKSLGIEVPEPPPVVRHAVYLSRWNSRDRWVGLYSTHRTRFVARVVAWWLDHQGDLAYVGVTTAQPEEIPKRLPVARVHRG